MDYGCRIYHDSCAVEALKKFLTIIKYTFRIYLVAHSAPNILYAKKRQEFFKNPFEFLIKLLKQILRSMGFMSGFVMAMRIFPCVYKHYVGNVDKLFIFLVSILASLPVLIDEVKRAEEYTIFTLPRVLEGSWDFFKKLGYVHDIPYSMPVIFGLSIGSLCIMKKFHNKEMPASYEGQMSLFFGKEKDKTVKEEN